jgi:hypothetical protein
VKILIATGLAREARLMAGPGVAVIAGGGDGARLERELEEACPGADLILSSGLAGGLEPRLVAGDLVFDGPRSLVEQLRAMAPWAHVGKVLGSDSAIASVAGKAEAHRSGAVAVDMESHIARRVAARRGLPCLTARVISDAAGEALPPAALAGMSPNGEIDVARVVQSLARDPAQLPALIRTARTARIGLRELSRLHDALRAGGIFSLDLRQFPLDV